MDPASFGALLRGDPTTIPLDQAAIAIAAALRPGANGDRTLAELDELAATCPAPTIDALTRHLFDDNFVGNRTHYYDWRNSCLDHVLETRTGIPITLSIVLIEVARRLDLSLVGVGMPAHFLVASEDDHDMFIDPYDGGAVFDRSVARRRFADLTNNQMTWDESYLDPTPARAIVIRMLNNLRAIFGQGNDAVRLAIVTRLRLVIPELEDEHDDAMRALAVLN